MAETKAVQSVHRFNEECPVGTAVIVTLDDGTRRPDKVRYPASMLGGHTPVAWLEDTVGAYLLTRVRKASSEGER